MRQWVMSRCIYACAEPQSTGHSWQSCGLSGKQGLICCGATAARAAISSGLSLRFTICRCSFKLSFCSSGGGRTAAAGTVAVAAFAEAPAVAKPSLSSPSARPHLSSSSAQAPSSPLPTSPRPDLACRRRRASGIMRMLAAATRRRSTLLLAIKASLIRIEPCWCCRQTRTAAHTPLCPECTRFWESSRSRSRWTHARAPAITGQWSAVAQHWLRPVRDTNPWCANG